MTKDHPCNHLFRHAGNTDGQQWGYNHLFLKQSWSDLLKKYLFIYLAAPGLRSQLWHVGSLVEAGEPLIAACGI